MYDDNGEGLVEYDYDFFVIGVGSGGVWVFWIVVGFGVKVCEWVFVIVFINICRILSFYFFLFWWIFKLC